MQSAKSVLIVEDSHVTRSMIRSIVEDLGDVVTTEASTGFEALRLLPTRDFSLIVTDINMPDVNGLELINFVRNDARYRDIPVLIVSTEKTEEDRRRGLALGANDYVTKPFSPDRLQETVKRLLEI